MTPQRDFAAPAQFLQEQPPASVPVYFVLALSAITSSCLIRRGIRLAPAKERISRPTGCLVSNFFGSFETQADLDTAYDVESTVEDIGSVGAAYQADSERARSILQHRLGIPYGPTLMETLDVFTPESHTTNAPILNLIHGGYWRALTAQDFSFVSLGPVAAGFAVVCVTYGLCPEVTIDEIVRQARAAVAWTARNAESFGGDKTRIVVGGHSAGGHLAVMTLLTDWSRYGLDEHVIKGAIAISGLFDLEPIACSFMQPTLRITSGTARWQSPIRNLRKVPAPLVTSWGTDELSAFVGQSEDFAAAWRTAGNRGAALPIEGAHHFNVLDGLKRADGKLNSVHCELVEG